LGGQIDFAFTQASNALPHLHSGEGKAYEIGKWWPIIKAADIKPE
jgi:tripartite-type tricarboxylate transporter receptor subunit TctC